MEIFVSWKYLFYIDLLVSCCKMTHMKHRRKSLGPGLCPICGKRADRPGNSYCRVCHTAYARANRPKYGALSARERRRNIARSYVGVLRRRGKIIADICFWCGSRERIELHHPDINYRPHAVIPLCHLCHGTLHGRCDGDRPGVFILDRGI